jgi:integrase
MKRNYTHNHTRPETATIEPGEHKEGAVNTKLSYEYTSPAEWKKFEYNVDMQKLTPSARKMGPAALYYLNCILSHLYGEASLSTLLSRHTVCDLKKAQMRPNLEEAILFNASACEVAQGIAYSKPYCQRLLAAVRKILLQETKLLPSFIAKLVVTWDLHAEDSQTLPRRYGGLPADDPTRLRLEKWAGTIRAYTHSTDALCNSQKAKQGRARARYGIKSTETLKCMMRFIINQVLGACHLTPEDWNDETSPKALEIALMDLTIVQSIVGTKTNAHCKYRWLQYACVVFDLVLPFTIEVVLGAEPQARNDEPFQATGDVHRISNEDLQTMYDSLGSSALDRMLFLLFATTGLRIKGICHLRIDRIAQRTGDGWKAMEYGETVEKGNKWHTFFVYPGLRKLITVWLERFRPCSPSPYLIPGMSGKHASTTWLSGRVKGWAEQAGLVGAQYHPHAFRHSYGHIQIEAGQDASYVCKTLGHSNVMVTIKYYLKETLKETMERSDVYTLEHATTAKQKGFATYPQFMQDARLEKHHKRRRVAVAEDDGGGGGGVDV